MSLNIDIKILPLYIINNFEKKKYIFKMFKKDKCFNLILASLRTIFDFCIKFVLLINKIKNYLYYVIKGNINNYNKMN